MERLEQLEHPLPDKGCSRSIPLKKRGTLGTDASHITSTFFMNPYRSCLYANVRRIKKGPQRTSFDAIRFKPDPSVDLGAWHPCLHANVRRTKGPRQPTAQPEIANPQIHKVISMIYFRSFRYDFKYKYLRAKVRSPLLR